MKQLIIFVGDVGDHVRVTAQNLDAQAFLIDHSNYQQVLNGSLNCGVGYTSVGDLPRESAVIFKLLDCADRLIYCETTAWSDGKTLDAVNLGGTIQGFTEAVMMYFQQTKNNVTGLNIKKYQVDLFTQLADQRQTNESQLWVVGCSISHGKGVDLSQRYGQLLANCLGLPVSFLTANGSSIAWQADQILRSNIKQNDIVVWGLTSENRFPAWADQNKVIHVHPHWKDYNEHSLDLADSAVKQLLVSGTLFYQAITQVHQVQNFCEKIGAKLLIFSALSSFQLNVYLGNTLKNFKHCYYPTPFQHQYIDLGSDNEHPGIEHHKFYSQFCLKQLKNLEFI